MLEEYLIGLTAVQIPDGYPKEAVKAQAILARTALYREMDGADSLEESALDMDYLEPEQIESRFEAAGIPDDLWGGAGERRTDGDLGWGLY